MPTEPRHSRRCRWCGDTFRAARSDARYCSPEHRVAAHRAGRRDAAERAREARSRDRSGRQLSYRKAVDAAMRVAFYFAGPEGEDTDAEEARAIVEGFMRWALPERQRPGVSSELG